MSSRMSKQIEGRAPLSEVDSEIFSLIKQEEQREADKLRLIASENYASRAVLEASGSCLTNKYSEGYAHKRYYEGQQLIDKVEELAKSRLVTLFGSHLKDPTSLHVNVQPYSGSPANLAVYLAFVKPGETVMGLGLPAGGHLTHGHTVSITGKFFKSVPYGVTKDTHRIDLDEVRKLALEHRPKLIWAGTTAYPRTLDFAAFRSIADECGAILAADIAHISGLVAAGLHPTPVGIADVITSTTHKTLRGPRGGMLMCKAEHASALDRAVFPGLQGGPHNHTTAAIAVAAKEATTPEFAAYAKRIVDNAKALAGHLVERGFSLITGGTDNHLLLVDMTPKNIGGKPFAQALDRAGIVCNYNAIPFDPRKPFDPSGIRIGTPSLSSRGMGVTEMQKLADFMARVAKDQSPETLDEIAAEVRELCSAFPAPGLMV